MHKLICLSGMNKGEELPLIEGENSIGRSEKNNICVFDKKVSRIHCRLHVSEKSVVLEDFGSTNGSRINNVLVNGKQEVKPGDHLRVGQTVFLLSDTPLSETAENGDQVQGDDKEYETLLEATSFHVTKTTAFRKIKTDKSGSNVGFLSFFEKENK
ncbi:MAG: FHA domain-containing protein [Victivallales bacterium]